MIEKHTTTRPTIYSLGLQTRTERLLKQAGMRYIDQVEHISDAELDQCPGFGKVSRADLRARIEAYRQKQEKEQGKILEPNTTGRLNVITMSDLTQPQQESLHMLGCEAEPYLVGLHLWAFAATCTGKQEQELRRLAYVLTVELMPVFRIC